MIVRYSRPSSKKYARKAVISAKVGQSESISLSTHQLCHLLQAVLKTEFVPGRQEAKMSLEASSEIPQTKEREKGPLRRMGGGGRGRSTGGATACSVC